MAKVYTPTPCRSCGGIREFKHSHFCRACSEAMRREYDRTIQRCQSNDPKHVTWTCPECREIKRQRQREAAQRGAATRRKNNPGWAKPWNAQRFWQGKAQGMVAAAKRQGLLPQLDGSIACTDCGAPAQEYDHRDYGRPLDVQPVCRSCNKRRGTAKWPSPDQFDFPKVAPQNEAA